MRRAAGSAIAVALVAAVTLIGPAAQAADPQAEVRTSHLEVYDAGVSTSFGPSNFDLTDEVAEAFDMSGTSTDACQPIINSVSGMIALIDHSSSCGSAVKVKNAQNVGAIGVLIANDVPGGGTFALTGTDNSISIPSLSISYEDGAGLRQDISEGTVDARMLRNDTDGDGIQNEFDNCPNTINVGEANNDGDAEGDACDTDDDNDTRTDVIDNCPFVANVNQENTDPDPSGDACDPDDDNDGVVDNDDNCPLLANGSQSNQDADSVGDACDSDDDNDGVNDTVPDNCPFESNNDQTDTNNDSEGDACDDDDDGDTTLDGADECPLAADPSDDGCPEFERTLTLSYTKSTKTFSGLISSTVTACEDAQEVEIFKEVSGPDTSLGQATSAPDGSYALVLGTKAKRGKYYAHVDTFIAANDGRCAAATKTKRIR